MTEEPKLKPLNLAWSDKPIMSAAYIAVEDDKTRVSIWDRKTHTLTYTLTSKSDDNPFGVWFKRQREDFRRKKKIMSYAVTHGYTIRILVTTKNDELGYIEVTKPRQLNVIFRHISFIPKYRIIKNHRLYDIRKGRLCNPRVWSVSQELIDEWEKKWRKMHN